MMLQRITPVSSFTQLGREVEHMFGDILRASDSVFGPSRRFPALNVWEDGDQVFVQVEVPGLKREDVEVEVLGEELTIRGRRDIPGDDDATYLRRERGTGEFERVLTLPIEIDREKIAATLKNGVLTITLAKHPQARPKRIEVGQG